MPPHYIRLPAAHTARDILRDLNHYEDLPCSPPTVSNKLHYIFMRDDRQLFMNVLCCLLIAYVAFVRH
jgi:hypothetical protein